MVAVYGGGVVGQNSCYTEYSHQVSQITENEERDALKFLLLDLSLWIFIGVEWGWREGANSLFYKQRYDT